MEPYSESFGEIEIKKEEVHESDWNNWTPTVTAREEEDKKCGEILLSSQGNLTLVCILCTENFVNLQSFGLHIQSKHLKVQTDSNNDDPSSLKVEEGSHSPDIHRPKTELPSNSNPSLTTIDAQPKTHSADNSDNIEGLYNKETDPNYNPTKTITEHDGSKLTTRNDITDAQTTTCKYCDQNFPGKDELKEHLKTHTGSLRYVCQFCPKKFANRALRQSHINIHTGERPHKCSYCPKAFANFSNLRSHESRHSETRKHKCDYCDKSFVRPNQKIMHERTHTGEKPYPCPECGKRFRVSYKMKRHMVRHENAKICNQEFDSAGLLTRYVLVHTKDETEKDLMAVNSIPIKLEPLDPPTVEDGFSSSVNEEKQSFETQFLPKDHQSTPKVVPPNLGNTNEPDNGDDSDHMEELYDDEIESEVSKTNATQSSSDVSKAQNMTCKYCDRTFIDLDKLKEHRHTHTGPKRFVCSFCPKTFRTRAMRQAHINVHTGERPYKCTFCPKAFAQASNLQAHINIHTGDRSYECTFCPKTFATIAGLNFHKSAHLQIKKYQCNYCDKTFVQPTQKTMHERTHTGEKPYPCTKCGKRFRRTDTLKTHMFVHTKDVPL